MDNIETYDNYHPQILEIQDMLDFDNMDVMSTCVPPVNYELPTSDALARHGNRNNLTPSPKSIMSTRKKMSKEDSCRLDLTYITERIIAMTFLSSGDESNYRNNLREILQMLKSKHGENYTIINLSEKRNDMHKLNPNVLDFGWPDHLSPALERLCSICKSIDSKLNSDPRNVVVIHCKGGKGRTGTVIAAYMHYINICASDDSALDRFAMERFYDQALSNFMQPSQIRYVHYFAGLLEGAIKSNSNALYLHHIVMHGIPNFDDRGSCRPFFKVYQGMSPIYVSGVYSVKENSPRLCVTLDPCLLLKGDILIKCYHKHFRSREVIFRCQFHTCAISEKGLVFNKSELDEACTDPRYPANGRVELVFSVKPDKQYAHYHVHDQSQPVEPSIGSLERWDSYENFNVRPQDATDELDANSNSTTVVTRHIEGPIDGSLYATVNKKEQRQESTNVLKSYHVQSSVKSTRFENGGHPGLHNGPITNSADSGISSNTSGYIVPKSAPPTMASTSVTKMTTSSVNQKQSNEQDQLDEILNELLSENLFSGSTKSNAVVPNGDVSPTFGSITTHSGNSRTVVSWQTSSPSPGAKSSSVTQYTHSQPSPGTEMQHSVQRQEYSYSSPPVSNKMAPPPPVRSATPKITSRDAFNYGSVHETNNFSETSTSSTSRDVISPKPVPESYVSPSSHTPSHAPVRSSPVPPQRSHSYEVTAQAESGPYHSDSESANWLRQQQMKLQARRDGFEVGQRERQEKQLMSELKDSFKNIRHKSETSSMTSSVDKVDAPMNYQPVFMTNGPMYNTGPTSPQSDTHESRSDQFKTEKQYYVTGYSPKLDELEKSLQMALQSPPAVQESHTRKVETNIQYSQQEYRSPSPDWEKKAQSVDAVEQARSARPQKEPEVEHEVISLQPIGPGMQNLEPDGSNSGSLARSPTPSFPVTASDFAYRVHDPGTLQRERSGRITPLPFDGRQTPLQSGRATPLLPQSGRATPYQQNMVNEIERSIESHMIESSPQQQQFSTLPSGGGRGDGMMQPQNAPQQYSTMPAGGSGKFSGMNEELSEVERRIESQMIEKEATLPRDRSKRYAGSESQSGYSTMQSGAGSMVKGVPTTPNQMDFGNQQQQQQSMTRTVQQQSYTTQQQQMGQSSPQHSGNLKSYTLPANSAPPSQQGYNTQQQWSTQEHHTTTQHGQHLSPTRSNPQLNQQYNPSSPTRSNPQLNQQFNQMQLNQQQQQQQVNQQQFNQQQFNQQQFNQQQLNQQGQQNMKYATMPAQQQQGGYNQNVTRTVQHTTMVRENQHQDNAPVMQNQQQRGHTQIIREYEQQGRENQQQQQRGHTQIIREYEQQGRDTQQQTGQMQTQRGHTQIVREYEQQGGMNHQGAQSMNHQGAQSGGNFQQEQQFIQQGMNAQNEQQFTQQRNQQQFSQGGSSQRIVQQGGGSFTSSNEVSGNQGGVMLQRQGSSYDQDLSPTMTGGSRGYNMTSQQTTTQYQQQHQGQVMQNGGVMGSLSVDTSQKMMGGGLPRSPSSAGSEMSPASPGSLHTYRSQMSSSQQGTMNTGQSSPSVYFGHSRRGSQSSLADGSDVVHTTPRFVRDQSKFWYKPHISRDEAITLLKDKVPGTFVVRDSNSFPGAFGLAVKVAQVPPNVQTKGSDPLAELVRHFLIEPTNKGVKLKGCSNEPVFGSLAALVYQHSITPLALPCKLLLPEGDTSGSIDAVDAGPQQSQAKLLAQGAACNVLYLTSMDIESLTGNEAVSKCVKDFLMSSGDKKKTVVHFKVSSQGITLTDNNRKLFFRRHYPVNTVTYCGTDPKDRRYQDTDEEGRKLNAKIFGFVARKQGSTTDNACHLFCELDPDQPASAIVSFVTKVMIGQGKVVKT